MLRSEWRERFDIFKGGNACDFPEANVLESSGSFKMEWFGSSPDVRSPDCKSVTVRTQIPLNMRT